MQSRCTVPWCMLLCIWPVWRTKMALITAQQVIVSAFKLWSVPAATWYRLSCVVLWCVVLRSLIWYAGKGNTADGYEWNTCAILKIQFYYFQIKFASIRLRQPVCVRFNGTEYTWKTSELRPAVSLVFYWWYKTTRVYGKGLNYILPCVTLFLRP